MVKITHLHLNLDVDFDRNILNGKAILSIEKVQDSASEVILDVRGLNIKSINDEVSGQALEYTIHPEGYVGGKLEIQLQPLCNDKL